MPIAECASVDMKHRFAITLIASLALGALWPSESRAAGTGPATRTLFALQPLAALHWDAPSLLRVQPLLVGPARTTRASFSFGYRRPLPKLLDPRLSAWVSSRTSVTSGQPLSVQLARPRLDEDERSQVDDAARLGMSYLNPTLLRFADDATDVAVSISPGGLCTGACLKVTGSFQ